MVLVPFVHFSVYMFRTLHPMPIVLKPSEPSLPVSMLATLLFSVSVFTLLYVGFVTQRYALSYLREQLEATAGGGDPGRGLARNGAAKGGLTGGGPLPGGGGF